MGLLDAFSGKSQRRAAEAMDRRIAAGRAEADALYGRSFDQATNLARRARQDFAPLAELGQQGAERYAGALGLRGQEGIQAAQQGFQEAPGYQYALDQGQDALMRSASARGALQSGGMSLDLLRHAQGMANQGYNQYLDRLGGYNQMLGQAAAGRAGINQNLAGLQTGIMGNRANLAYNANLAHGEAAQSNIMAGQQAVQNAWNFGQNVLQNGLFGGGYNQGQQGPPSTSGQATGFSPMDALRTGARFFGYGG